MTPERIGPYRIIEPLGQGGMGRVYLAEQEEPIRRLLALKVIRATTSDPAAIHRFEAERQALARMNHPHIAQVYGAGETEDGAPYIAMQYVPGVPVTEYCDSRELDLDARLGLFVDVCRGIHHAHQKGVLHRDIKPSNVLVTEDEGRPVVRIIDFGIAKALDEPLSGEARLTETSVVVGTPAYLSPEAFGVSGDRQDVDIRSDVYALGVLLFELLTGRLPLGRAGDSLLEILRLMATAEIPAPSERVAALRPEERSLVARRRRLAPVVHVRRLKGDLDWIALKAMAAEREDRYSSAVELAQDVDRHRESLPVEASPPSRIYRARKFLRRHRAAVAGCVLVVVALLAGFVARSLEADRANRAAAAARRAEAEAREVVEFLVSLFEVADPESSRGRTVTAGELLDAGARRVRFGLRGQPHVQARMMETIGEVYGQLGLYEPSRELLEEALARRESMGEGAPAGLAGALEALAMVDLLTGEYATARARFERALEIRRQVGDPLATARALDDLGLLAKIQGRYAEAEGLHRRSLALAEGAGDPVAQARSLERLAVALFESGRPAEAEPLIRRALELRKEAQGADHPDVAGTLNSLGIAVAHLDRPEEAAEIFREALELRRQTLGPSHPEVAQLLNNLATIELDLGHRDEGRRLLEEAIEVWTASLGADHQRVAIATHNLGDLWREEGEVEAAEACYRRAIEIFSARLGPDHPSVAYPWKGLGDLWATAGRRDEALEAYARSLEIRRASLEPGAELLAETASAYAGELRAAGREEEADAVEASLPAPAGSPE